ncbi:hypothetical protein QBC36DRAFT_60828 [Triangularia setosa]|uniref:Uncharacterized protein n=1 Tax=Triangularia setosa TaxID=2587417 RepID=A0AAN7AA53_9PEZI|nr:hypothetical protein QBC36DRAFT_60828 [Podospora setosa]
MRRGLGPIFLKKLLMVHPIPFLFPFPWNFQRVHLLTTHLWQLPSTLTRPSFFGRFSDLSFPILVFFFQTWDPASLGPTRHHSFSCSPSWPTTTLVCTLGTDRVMASDFESCQGANSTGRAMKFQPYLGITRGVVDKYGLVMLCHPVACWCVWISSGLALSEPGISLWIHLSSLSPVYAVLYTSLAQLGLNLSPKTSTKRRLSMSFEKALSRVLGNSPISALVGECQQLLDSWQ